MPARLRQLYHEEHYRVVILSNQGGLTLHPDPHAKTKGPKNLGKDRVAKFKQKCAAVLAQLDIPTAVYAATGKDGYRKPRAGMWAEVCDDYDLAPAEVDREASFFVGDAGGRTARMVEGGGSGGEGDADQKKKKKKTKNPAVAKDFSCSDRNFAHNVGVAYRTPEEYFLGEAPREFLRDFDLAAFPYPYPPATTTTTNSSKEERTKEEGEPTTKEDADDSTKEAAVPPLFERKNARDLVLFCGPPGSGKSTFFRRYLQPLGYERVNQDTLKTRAKCLRAASDCLEAGGAVAVDNTNPDREGRREWVELARRHGVPIRCVWLRAPAAVCEHNDVVRALNRGVRDYYCFGLIDYSESRPSSPSSHSFPFYIPPPCPPYPIADIAVCLLVRSLANHKKIDEPRSPHGAPQARVQQLLRALPGAHGRRGLPGRGRGRLPVPRHQGRVSDLGAVLDLSG